MIRKKDFDRLFIMILDLNDKVEMLEEKQGILLEALYNLKKGVKNVKR